MEGDDSDKVSERMRADSAWAHARSARRRRRRRGRGSGREDGSEVGGRRVTGRLANFERPWLIRRPWWRWRMREEQ